MQDDDDFNYHARPHIKVEDLPNCHGCGVKPGNPHVEGCDIERCSVCGLQRINYCHEADHDPLFSRWTGIWPTDAEARAVGVDLNEFIIQGYAAIMTAKPMELADTWVCICGNSASSDGFDTCNSEGEEVEPTPQEWTSGWYVCARCKRIINDTRLVVGVAFGGPLSQSERAAVYGSRGQRVGLWDEDKANETVNGAVPQ